MVKVLQFLLLVSIFLLTSCVSSTTQLLTTSQQFTHSSESKKSDDHVIIESDSLFVDFLEKPKGNKLSLRYVTWYRINNPISGDLKDVFWYDNEYLESPPKLDITLIYKDGKKVKKVTNIKRGRISNHSSYRYALWMDQDGTFQSYGGVSDYNKLAFIRVEVNQTFKKPIHFNRELIRSSYFAKERVFTLTLPKKNEINLGLHNEEALPYKDTTMQISPEKSKRVFTFKNVPIKKDSDYYKKPEDYFAALYFTFPNKSNKSISWKELGDNYLEIIEDSIITDTELFKRALKEPDLPKDKDSLIVYLFEYVKSKIRYYGSWEKNYGFVPRSCNTVIKSGYGDCKEMAVVLTGLYRKFNITSDPVLIMTSGNYQLNESYPGLGYFNHMITSALLSNGKRMYLDPTHKSEMGKNSYYNHIGQKVFVLQKDNSFVTTIPPLAQYRNHVKTVSKITAYENKWKIKGTIHLYGHIATLLKNKTYYDNKVNSVKLLTSYLRRTFGISAQTARIVRENPEYMEISYSSDISGNIISLSNETGLRLTTPQIGRFKNHFSKISIPGNRTLFHYTQEDYWTIPEEFSILNSYDFSHSYGKGTWSKEGTTVKRTYSTNDTVVSHDERKTLKSFISQRGKFYNATIWK